MVSGRRAVVLVVLVALAATIEGAWLAPATLVDARIASATRQAVRLADAEGTVWRGRGTLTVATTRLPVAWEVNGWPLLRGVVQAQIRSGSGLGTPRATIAANRNGIALSDVDVALPAAALAGLLGNVGPGTVAGDVTGSTDDLDLTPRSRRGEARLLWRGAKVAGVVGGTSLDLGDVRSSLKAQGDTIAGQLINEGGDLALRGEWKLNENEDLTLALMMTPRRADQVELTRALAAFATAENEGWRVNWRIPLR